MMKEIIDKKPEESIENSKIYVVDNCEYVKVRRVPYLTGAIEYILKKGIEVEIESINNGWAKIKDTELYINENFIREK